jgi:hypothetical protein
MISRNLSAVEATGKPLHADQPVADLYDLICVAGQKQSWDRKSIPLRPSTGSMATSTRAR